MIDLYRRSMAIEFRMATVLRIDGARVIFDIKRDDTAHANLADIKIYNLAESTRSKIKRGVVVDLTAGFIDVSGSIFRGSVYEIQTAGAGADIITAIKASDAAGAGTLALSYKGATPWSTVAIAACRAVSGVCGVRLGNSIEAIGQSSAPSYPRGYACKGRAMPELSRILAAAGLSVSVQSGDLVVLVEGVAAGVGQVISLSPATGLIGTPALAAHKPPGAPPDKSPKGHVIKALLQPRIYPGCMVHVESSVLTGQYRVKSVGHSGDTEGSNWFTGVEVYQ